MLSKLDAIIILGAVLIVIGMVALVGGSGNETNSTQEMLLGDNWDCGFITNKTTLEDIRDCFRD